MIYQLIGVCAGAAVAAVCLADDAARQASLSLDTGGSFMFETDLDGAGDYSVGRAAVGLAYSVPAWDRSTLRFGLDVERSEYDFSGATGLAPGGDPLGGATAYSFDARLIHPLDGTWTIVGGTGVVFAGEDGAGFSDTAMVNGFGAVAWKASDDLTLTLGVRVQDRLEDDVRVLPVLGVEWEIDDTLSVSSSRAARVLGGAGGGGVGLVYASGSGPELVIGAGFSSREFRLDESGPVPDGVLRDDRVVAGIGLAWDPSEAVSASVGVGLAVWSDIETLGSNGATVGDEDGDPAAYITARVRVLF